MLPLIIRFIELNHVLIQWILLLLSEWISDEFIIFIVNAKILTDISYLRKSAALFAVALYFLVNTFLWNFNVIDLHLCFEHDYWLFEYCCNKEYKQTSLWYWFLRHLFFGLLWSHSQWSDVFSNIGKESILQYFHKKKSSAFWHTRHVTDPNIDQILLTINDIGPFSVKSKVNLHDSHSYFVLRAL